MVNFITAFFGWSTQILQLILQTEIIDGYKFIHVVLFLFIVAILVKFIQKLKKGGKNDKSE